jgi:membrane-associated phospholipid phosphatase
MRQRWIALGSAFAFIALAILVHFGLMDRLDTVVREWARPDDVWGTAQVRADVVVEGLGPAVLAVLLAAFTLAYCLNRRSLIPAAFIGSICLMAAALTIASKVAVARLNPHGVLGNDGGSFPSGHMIGVTVCLGIVALVAQPRASWWVWLIPTLGGGLMGAALLLQASHWSTDIVGGALLGTGVLAATIASAPGRWMHDRSGNDHGSVASKQRNSTSPLAPVGQIRRWIARLNSTVPVSGLTDCYAPGRGKLVLRSCGGL